MKMFRTLCDIIFDWVVNTSYMMDSFCSCRQTLPESQAISGVCLLVYKDCSLRTMTNKLFGNK